MKIRWSTPKKVLEQAAHDRLVSRYTFDRQMAEYIQHRANPLAVEAKLKVVADEQS